MMFMSEKVPVTSVKLNPRHLSSITYLLTDKIRNILKLFKERSGLHSKIHLFLLSSSLSLEGCYLNS